MRGDRVLVVSAGLTRDKRIKQLFSAVFRAIDCKWKSAKTKTTIAKTMFTLKLFCLKWMLTEGKIENLAAIKIM